MTGDRLGTVTYFRRLAAGDVLLVEEGLVESGGGPIRMMHNSSPCVTDWNGDGLPDLVIGQGEGYPAGLFLYVNVGSPGSPLFAGRDTVERGGEPVQVYYGYPDMHDMDGDGLPDLVYGSSTGKIACLPNAGSPGAPLFDSLVYLEADGEEINFYSYVRPTVCDWDEDGLPDLLVGDQDGYANLFLGTGYTGIDEGGNGSPEPSVEACANPTPGPLDVRLSRMGEGPASLRLYSLEGRLLEELWSSPLPPPEGLSLPLDLSGNSPGVYLLVLDSGAGRATARATLLR